MSIDWNRIAHDDRHRPWSVPDKPWVMTMSWLDVLMAHWPVAPEKLEPYIPDGLTLDTFDGEAWVSAIAFDMDNTVPRGLTWWPKPMHFLELNLRTYVTVDGQKPGIWFFSLDAESRLAVMGARTTFHLPYFFADMAMSRVGDTVDYHSQRTRRDNPQGAFSARYRPTGPAAPAEEGSLSHWLSERYCLYALDSAGTIYRGDINHKPWPLRPAEVDIHHNTLGRPLGLDLPDAPALASFADRQDVVGWFRHPIKAN